MISVKCDGSNERGFGLYAVLDGLYLGLYVFPCELYNMIAHTEDEQSRVGRWY